MQIKTASPVWAEGVHTTPYQVLNALLAWIYSMFVTVYSLFRKASPFQVYPGRPAAPALKLIDARSTRVKLSILLEESTDPEAYEFQIRYRLDNEGAVVRMPEQEDEENWIVETFKTGIHRNLLSLHEHSQYKARARAKTELGICSEWGPLIKWQTLLAPVNGGANMGSYTWGQNATDVWVTVQIPAEVKSKHVSVVLQPTSLHVSHTVKNTVVAVLGKLPWRVRLLSPDGGSHWEISRESGTSSLCVVLEKESPAANLKWGLWRSMFAGHDEIDTHAMELDPHIAEILQSLHRQPGSRLDSAKELDNRGPESGG